MIRSMPLLLLLLAVTAPVRTAADGPAGDWELSYLKPGVVEPAHVHLRITPGADNTVTAEATLPDTTLPLAGAFDPDTGELTLAATTGPVTRVTLRLDADRLHGNATLAGRPLALEGRRATAPPQAPAAIDLTVERPTRARGELPPPLAGAGRAAIEEALSAQPIVGLSAAFVENGAVVAELSFGWEDYARGTPASERTLYRWASVSKPLTAVAALQLAAAGRLDLDADTRKWVPEYDKGVAITTRQLLCHRGGVPHYAQLKVRTVKPYDHTHPWTDRIIALDMFVESDLVKPPGEAYHYSTPGYALLGAVIERAGGARYVEQVNERICRPLGMTSMRPDHVWEQVPHHAAAYARDGERAVAVPLDDISWKLPAGGFISTIGDMGRFAAGLLGADLLDPATRDLMWGLGRDADGKERPPLGIGVGRLDGRRIIFHSGGQVGTSTYLLACPDTGNAVVLAANTQGIRLNDLARRLLGLWIAATP